MHNALRSSDTNEEDILKS